MFNKILAVCVGNICRSPMVEAVLKNRLNTSDSPIRISSAGLAALVGYGADPHVQEILDEQGIGRINHKARQLSQELVLDADLILVMEHQHRRQIESLYPNACGKVHLLGKWGNFEVPDPYRKPKDFFKHTYHLVIQGISEWQEKIWK